MSTAKRQNIALKNKLFHTWTGTDVFFVDDFRMKGAGYFNSSIVLTEATKSTNDKAWISFADAGIRIILGRFVRVFTGLIRVITQRFVGPSIPSKPRFHSLINFGRNLNFLIVVLFLNQSYFFKGGLMSESFSIWPQSK